MISFDIPGKLNLKNLKAQSQKLSNILVVSFPSSTASLSKVIIYDLDEEGDSSIMMEIPYTGK